MRVWIETAEAVLASFALLAVWDVAVVAALRAAGVKLSFLLSFRVFDRRHELFAAVRSRNAYVFISGVLLFACPFFVLITFYAYIVRTFIDHKPYSLASVVGSMVFLLLFVMVGIWSSLSQWDKRPNVTVK